MKKAIFSTFIFLIAVVCIQAQEVKFGAKAGVNFASINGDDTDGLDGKTSIHFGGVTNISISELFALQVEALYSRQGFKDNNPDATIFLDYLNVPILADFTLAEGFSLQGGPQVGLKLNSLVKNDASGNEVDLDNVQGVDFGVGIGGQYQLPVGLFFQARYIIGVVDVFDNFDGKHSVASLSVGWFFN